jgi:hypothetical protein
MLLVTGSYRHTRWGNDVFKNLYLSSFFSNVMVLRQRAWVIDLRNRFYSPFLSEQAAESLPQHKNSYWLLPYQCEDIEGHIARNQSALTVTFHSIGVLI